MFEQIMTAKPRADVYMNLPALRKLDSMLLVGALSYNLLSVSTWTTFLNSFFLALVGNVGFNG